MVLLSAGVFADGSEIYHEACAACHGADGTGVSTERLGFGVPPPDFTDCSFATREATLDWVAVAHDGGPVRGFSRFMPAFGKALTVAELEAAIRHIRTFCENDAWPRGEFNLPRALVTTKAFPEDEVVLENVLNLEGDGPGRVELKAVFEKRVGARNQVEVALPLGWQEGADPDGSGDWRSVQGDLAVGYKRVLYDNMANGRILSVNLEALLPTGDESAGFSSDTVVVEPQMLFGQLLPRDYFLQGQAGLGLPFDDDKIDSEAFWRIAFGRTLTEGRWGRAWTPMVEVTGARALDAGADTEWDLVPQLQVTLPTRQHVRLNVGARVPLTDTGKRDTAVVLYVLWDFFDGGVTEGW